MNKLNLIKLVGSHYDIGYQHGKRYRDEIKQFVAQRVALSQSKVWTGRELSYPQVLALAEACVVENLAYSPELMTELQGMADASGTTLAELIIVNGYTDFIDVVYNIGALPQPAQLVADDCTAFLVPNSSAIAKQGMLGQTWDMNVEAMPYLTLLHFCPNDAPEILLMTTVGCIGMIGMNDAGICVGINNLMGGDGQIGVIWNFVVRKMLMQTDIESALECLTSAKLSGAHNYLLLDESGRGYNVEAMSSQLEITPLTESPIVHTNHCLVPHTIGVERERPPASRAGTLNRLNRATELIQQSHPISPESLMALTRDQPTICVSPQPPFFTASCGAAIMRPATREFWAVKGLPAENEYESFQL